MKLAMMAGIALVACASVALAKPREATDVSVVTVAGGTTCPAGTTELYAGLNVLFIHPSNGAITEDTRCWQTPPTATTQFAVAIVGGCVVCRFGP